MTTGRSWARSPEALWRDTLDATVVLGRSAEPLRLRGTARPLWKALEAGGTSEELAALVAGTTDPEVIADLERALGTLVEAGAVVCR